MPSMSSKTNRTIATNASWNWQPQVAGMLGSPLSWCITEVLQGQRTDTQGISAKQASLHYCRITIILNRPLHSISKLSKICLFFLVHRTSEKLFTSLSLDWAKKLHLAKNSPMCNLLTRPVALFVVRWHAFVNFRGLCLVGPLLGMEGSPLPFEIGFTYFYVML